MKLRGSHLFSQARDAKNVKKEIHIHARAARSSGVYSAIIHAPNITMGTEQTKMLRPRFYLSK